MLGVRPVNPLKVEVTSAVVELVKLGLGGLTPDEVTDGRIRAAIEKREGLGLLVCSTVTSTLLSGEALKKSKRIEYVNIMNYTSCLVICFAYKHHKNDNFYLTLPKKQLY